MVPASSGQDPEGPPYLCPLVPFSAFQGARFNLLRGSPLVHVNPRWPARLACRCGFPEFPPQAARNRHPRSQRQRSENYIDPAFPRCPLRLLCAWIPIGLNALGQLHIVFDFFNHLRGKSCHGVQICVKLRYHIYD